MTKDAKEINEIWQKIKKKYIKVSNITGVVQDKIAKQIKKEMKRVNNTTGKRGDFTRLIKAEYPKSASEDMTIREEIVKQNVKFKEYKYRGTKAIGIIQVKGDKIDSRRAPPRRLTWTTFNKAEKLGINVQALLKGRVLKKFGIQL